MNTKRTISNQLIYKLGLTFTFLILLIGSAYVLITVYFTNKYFEETSQKLHADMAHHLIEEKFAEDSPFLEDGSINKPIFGDIMHDMMAVNRGIEVYLLDNQGTVLYSVVLDHNDTDKPKQRVSLGPIHEFIKSNGNSYVLGDNPRNPGHPKIFSAAPFTINEREGYIYIVLAGKEFEEVTDSLFSSYFIKLSLGASFLTMFFAAGVGFISIWFLTRNLREIIHKVKRFSEGDLNARIEKPETSDLSSLAYSFNEMADTIVKNLDEIRSVDNLRKELIANVSHDLRTPLAILQGYTETLEMKNKLLSEEEKENYFTIIRNSSEKLSRLVNQLFEYSKLEANQIEPQKEPFQITELALDISSKLEVIAAKKNISIEVQTKNDIPLVFADISLVERAIQNLMDNALKFSRDNGKITIHITSNRQFVEVMVKDNGPGISEDEQSIIFERFQQSSKNKEPQGAGLGLAIVKKILEIHNSSIKVVSKPNYGTAFLFQLPIYTESASL
ncbi:MAG: two-component sensor histidine kinase [Phycisphaeraceae bacterium]|nr:two-component sensor histidine kinase [Phycisphaeraceae bacterium]